MMTRNSLIAVIIVILLPFCKQKSESNAKIKSDDKANDKLVVPKIATTGLEKPKGFSFQVDEVAIADFLLVTDTAKKIFENKIGKKISFFPEEHASLILAPSQNNGLIQTLQECYDNHRPLVLTPDVIWLAICQGVSVHVNNNYKSLRKVIFTANKPDKILVRNDSLEYASKHWEALINSLSDTTKQYTKEDFYFFFVSDFTTTTAVDKTAYQITLLESYKKAFDYIGMTGCGIPSILVAGEKEDWQIILKKLDKLEKIGLGNWAKNLKPIIAEFISAAEGEPNKEFWKNIYKNAAEYNAFYISGWIIKFFPYIKTTEIDGEPDKETGLIKVEEVYEPNEFYEDDNYLLSTLSTDNFPTGISKIPLTWQNEFKKTKQEMEVYAGFFAMKQYPDKSLQPLISWAICEANADTISHYIAEDKIPELNHKSGFWSPNIVTNLTDSAIYDAKMFQSQSSSIAFVRKLILDSLQLQKIFKSAKYKNDTLQLQVLSNGKIGKVSLLKSKNVKLANYIKELLKILPEPWFPALAYYNDVLILMNTSDEDKKIKVRANSMVQIKL